jgi:hypothetical protein
MCSVLQQNLHLFLVSFLLFYGKKVGKKPTTNEKLQFALTHTPTPQSCQIEISRHSWTPPHSFRFSIKFSMFFKKSKPPKTTALNGTFLNL